MSRAHPSWSVEGLKQRLAKMERDIADLMRRGDWRFDAPEVAAGGIPTMFVAAANATAKSQALADYVCDGTDDHVEINAAINAAIAGSDTYGGRVLLSEGEFSTSDTITVGPGITLAGFNVATYIDTTSTVIAVDVDSDAVVENLSLAGWNAANSVGVRFGTSTSGPIRRSMVRGCAIAGYRFGVYAEDVSDLRILDNRFEGMDAWGVDILYGNSSGGAIVRGNVFRGSFHGVTTGAGGIDHLVIADNVFALMTGKIAVTVSGCVDATVAGNVVSDEVTAKSSSTAAVNVTLSSTGTTVSGNAINKQNGVAVVVDSSSSDVVIVGNAIWGHLEIDGADRVVTADNSFKVDATYPPTIAVLGGTDNCFSGNFLPGGLASFTDAGTTTQRGTNFAQGGTW